MKKEEGMGKQGGKRDASKVLEKIDIKWILSVASVAFVSRTRKQSFRYKGDGVLSVVESERTKREKPEPGRKRGALLK